MLNKKYLGQMKLVLLSLFVVITVFTLSELEFANAVDQIPPLRITVVDDERINHTNTNTPLELDLSSLEIRDGKPYVGELEVYTDDVTFGIFESVITGFSDTNKILSVGISTKIPTGFSSHTKIIEIGNPNLDLTFPKVADVRLLDQTNVLPGDVPFFINAANQTFAVPTCTELFNVDYDIRNWGSHYEIADELLGTDEVCYVIDDYDRIYFWTKHFTSFGIGTPIPVSDEKKNGSKSAGECSDCIPPVILIENEITQNTEINKPNTISFSSWEDKGPYYIQLVEIGLGVKDVESSIEDSQARIQVWMGYWLYQDIPNVKEIKVTDPDGIFATADVTITLDEECAKPIFSCLNTEFNYTYAKEPNYDGMIISTSDFYKNTVTNYYP